MVSVFVAGGDVAVAKKPRRVKVGERFVMYLGWTPIDAIVIEDMGDLGIGGRQLVRIRELPTGMYDLQREYEVPAEDIPSYGVPPAAPPPVKRKRAARTAPAGR